MLKRILPLFLAGALLISVVVSILSIHGLQGNARVINYAGVVRGATQRLVKQEMNGQPNDVLIARLDGILSELSTGEGENGLVRMGDDAFQELISQMQTQWATLKDEIGRVRRGEDNARLYELSEAYFDLADRTVSAAESYSERQSRLAESYLVFLSVLFVLLAGALAWYISRQDRRQRALKQAEDANRERHEALERMSQDLRAPMDDISELLYVTDIETYELLFVNEAGRKTFGVGEFSGQKCYKVLQGLDAPCEFCTTHLLVPGKNYTWEHTNPVTKRHYLLKDRLVEWDGRPAREEIAFDMTEAEAEKQALKYTLDAEQMMMEGVRTLYQEHDLDKSIPAVLGDLGRFLSADRTYFAMICDDNLLYNDYEWCKEGVTSQKDMLQGLPLSSIASWLPVFARRECVIIEDLETQRESKPQEYELLHVQDIRSLVAAPVEQDGKLVGLVGVDNPPPERIRSIGSLLTTLGYFLLLAYRRMQDERQLSHLSYYDTLTSFYNRNRYMEDCLALSGTDRSIGIVYLDVNGLKDINDQMGHAYGDKILVECAQHMREIFRESSYYRIGGDEFVIISAGLDQKTFEKRTAALRRRFQADSLCRAAIGSQWAAHTEDLQQLIARADEEMYVDKKEFYRKNPTSNRYRHHSDEVLHLCDPEVLREEIRRNRFVVYLQPKVSQKGSAVGAEALIRYRPSSGSLLMPGNFLPLLEESQTISQIDFYVLEHICAQLQTWERQGKQIHPISVNFSRCTLSQPDFVARLNALCRQYKVDKSWLEIELTETAKVASELNLKELIHSLRQEGFLVSIDDFGTEYANLAFLSTVDFDVLKLDKSLVADVVSNARARTIVETIVGICKKTNIQVVAEGIETADQLNVLQVCGVELVQGFLFSEPIPIGEYEKKYL